MGPQSNHGKNQPIPQRTNDLSREAVDAAFSVHTKLGPGLLESVYHTCMIHELRKWGLRVESEVAVPIRYDDLQIDAGLRLDVLVEDQLVLELKAVEEILPVHKSQTLTYLRLTGRRLGLLINFNVPLIKDGIQRIVN